MIGEVAPITNTFVSVPADMGDFNCASFIAGIIAGVLDSSKFVSDTKICASISDILLFFLSILPITECPRDSTPPR